jgi:hypothetical protein
MNTLRAAFPGRILSRFGDIQWPSNSLDLTAADFLLWGYLKAQVLTHTLPDINSLKNAIHQEMRLQMLCKILYVASWQVYLGDGSNALIIMEDISKTLY